MFLFCFKSPPFSSSLNTTFLSLFISVYLSHFISVFIPLYFFFNVQREKRACTRALQVQKYFRVKFFKKNSQKTFFNQTRREITPKPPARRSSIARITVFLPSSLFSSRRQERETFCWKILSGKLSVFLFLSLFLTQTLSLSHTHTRLLLLLLLSLLSGVYFWFVYPFFGVWIWMLSIQPTTRPHKFRKSIFYFRGEGEYGGLLPCIDGAAADWTKSPNNHLFSRTNLLIETCKARWAMSSFWHSSSSS